MNIQAFTEHDRVLYYEAMSPDGTKTVSFYNKSDKSPLSSEKKFLYDFSLGDYKLFTPTGLDIDVAQAILNSGLNVKDEILARVAAITAEEERVTQAIKKKNIGFNDKGEIVNSDNAVLGRFVRKEGDRAIGLIYEIYNSKNKLVGIWCSLRASTSLGDQNYTNLANELVLINSTKRIPISGSKQSAAYRLSGDNLANIILGYTYDSRLIP